MTKLKSFSQKKGFTLIELLVVIGILGILAAGLLAAVDPLEQLKKGRDQQRRNIAVELHNAMTRYYAINGTMPGTVAITLTAGAAAPAAVSALIDSGEIKSTFMKGLPAGTANPIISDMSSTNAVVCFNPESKSISGDPSTIFTGATVGDPGACPVSPTSSCYFCAQ